MVFDFVTHLYLFDIDDMMLFLCFAFFLFADRIYARP